MAGFANHSPEAESSGLSSTAKPLAKPLPRRARTGKMVLVYGFAEQVLDRRSAVEIYRILVAWHGAVNSDASYLTGSCDGSPVSRACYTTSGAHAVPQSPRQSAQPRPSSGEQALSIKLPKPAA